MEVCGHSSLMRALNSGQVWVWRNGECSCRVLPRVDVLALRSVNHRSECLLIAAWPPIDWIIKRCDLSVSLQQVLLSQHLNFSGLLLDKSCSLGVLSFSCRHGPHLPSVCVSRGLLKNSLVHSICGDHVHSVLIHSVFRVDPFVDPVILAHLRFGLSDPSEHTLQSKHDLPSKGRLITKSKPTVQILLHGWSENPCAFLV